MGASIFFTAALIRAFVYTTHEWSFLLVGPLRTLQEIRVAQ
jgi:hypothetical protein